MGKNVATYASLKKDVLSGNKQATAIFRKMTPVEKKFTLFYLEEPNFSKSYREAVAPKVVKSDSHACHMGRAIFSSTRVQAFLEVFKNRELEAFYKTVDTYFEMLDAEEVKYEQNKEGVWEEVGTKPNWQARKWGAEGITKLYGINREKEKTPGEGVLPAVFHNEFNVYLQSKGIAPVKMDGATDAVYEEVPQKKPEKKPESYEYGNSFKKFASGSKEE